jgi:hypothetical protein
MGLLLVNPQNKYLSLHFYVYPVKEGMRALGKFQSPPTGRMIAVGFSHIAGHPKEKHNFIGIIAFKTLKLKVAKKIRDKITLKWIGKYVVRKTANEWNRLRIPAAGFGITDCRLTVLLGNVYYLAFG